MDSAEFKRKVGSHDMYSVVKIGDRAFKDCKRLICLDMSSMFQVDIGTEALAGCSSLQEVLMPEMDTHPIKIGNRAFINSSCKYLSIPSNVSEIGDSAFFGMNAKIIAIDGCKLKTLGAAAFANSTVEYVTLDVDSIPANTFKNCKKLRYIELPKSLSEIGATAFRGCKSLKTFTVYPDLRKIGENAFSGVKLDCVSFNTLDDDVLKHSFSSICGTHIPNLIVFPAEKAWIYKKMCPKMFKKRISISVTGNYNFWVYDGIIDKEMAVYDARPIISQKVSKYFDGNAEILVTNGSGLSIVLERYNRNTHSGYTAVANSTPMEVEPIGFGTYWWCSGNNALNFSHYTHYYEYMFLLKDIKSPCSLTIELNKIDNSYN
ncbi:MAG: leucine-rich repeat domain-containing protein [Bacteroides sp.]|nr:leucine-rich repeat domain-containing protein [Bacteroides sp.]